MTRQEERRRRDKVGYALSLLREGGLADDLVVHNGDTSETGATSSAYGSTGRWGPMSVRVFCLTTSGYDILMVELGPEGATKARPLIFYLTGDRGVDSRVISQMIEIASYYLGVKSGTG